MPTNPFNQGELRGLTTNRTIISWRGLFLNCESASMHSLCSGLLCHRIANQIFTNTGHYPIVRSPGCNLSTALPLYYFAINLRIKTLNSETEPAIMNPYAQNELIETVNRYKNYTKSFQEWLIRTAIQRNEECARLLEDRNRTEKEYKISIGQQSKLVDVITESRAPLSDTSGLIDLRDAISSRKEAAYYHRIQNTADNGHNFFNGILENAQEKLSALIQVLPEVLETHELEDEASNNVFSPLSAMDLDSDLGDDTDPERDGSTTTTNSYIGKGKGKGRVQRKSIPKGLPPTKENSTKQHDSNLLAYLYKLARIRGIVRHIWSSVLEGQTNIITAALVTDLAMSHIKQNSAALVEDLEDAESPQRIKLSECVKTLYAKIKSNFSPDESSQLAELAMPSLFCLDAIKHIDGYFVGLSTSPGDASQRKYPRLPFMPFLQFFDTLRSNTHKLPLWDQFTEDMLNVKRPTNQWLPFGLQVILDVHCTLREEYTKVFEKTRDHCFDLADRMRTHMDYEDRMWALGTKPEYMTKVNVKFTNAFIRPLNTLLEWIDNVLRNKYNKGLPIGVFLTMHSTLAGITMSSYNRVYQSTSISKVQWFLITLCHLYNAAIQVGGLKPGWLDLDFIIDTHSAHRIFVGDPPTDPNDFYNRYMLATRVSTKFFASDYRRGDLAPASRLSFRKKHGLMSCLPLEEKIRASYQMGGKNDRWLRHHAIFNHLDSLPDATEDLDEDEYDDKEACKQLQDVFEQISSKLDPSSSRKRNRKSRKNARSSSKFDETHTPLFGKMHAELRSHEVNSTFDYLSFYRRAFRLVSKLKDEVFLDDAAQKARQSTMNKKQNPNNQDLITELLYKLKTNDGIAHGQIKRIAGEIGDFIQHEGEIEFDRAVLRLEGDWKSVIASYKVDEEEGRDVGPTGHVFPPTSCPKDGFDANSMKDPVHHGTHSEAAIDKTCCGGSSVKPPLRKPHQAYVSNGDNER